jgi:hypothetical protein
LNRGIAPLGHKVSEAQWATLSALFNTSSAKAALESSVACPRLVGIPVLTYSHVELDAAWAEMGMPTLALGGAMAGILPNGDSRHGNVLFLPTEMADDLMIIDHELLHLKQVREGRLSFSDGVSSWRENGEVTFSITEEEQIAFNATVLQMSPEEGMMAKLRHEFSKPWEREAYGMTTPRHVAEAIRRPQVRKLMLDLIDEFQ